MKGSVEWRKYMAANFPGNGHYGGKVVKFRRQGCAGVMSFGFQVIEVTRHLVADRRIVERAMRCTTSTKMAGGSTTRRGARRSGSSARAVATCSGWTCSWEETARHEPNHLARRRWRRFGVMGRGRHERHVRQP